MICWYRFGYVRVFMVMVILVQVWVCEDYCFGFVVITDAYAWGCSGYGVVEGCKLFETFACMCLVQYVGYGLLFLTSLFLSWYWLGLLVYYAELCLVCILFLLSHLLLPLNWVYLFDFVSPSCLAACYWTRLGFDLHNLFLLSSLLSAVLNCLCLIPAAELPLNSV